MKLVFYLFDTTVSDFVAVFHPRKLTDASYPFEEIPLRVENENIRAYLQANKPGRPSWMAFFDAHCDFGDRELRNQHNSLVIVIRSRAEDGDRFLALTAGHGHLALDKNLIEDDFGLTVTLNTIDEKKLRGVDARDLGTRTQQKRLALSYEAEIFELAFDPELEVVGGISGKPMDSDFADHVSGADSLSILRNVEWNELERICHALLERYSSRDFEERFRMATLQRRVKNKAFCAELDNHLIEALRLRSRDLLSVALPISEIDRVTESVLSTGRGSGEPLIPFCIDSVFSALNRAQMEHFDPRRLTVQHFDADGVLVDGKNLYRHLLFEKRLPSHHLRERCYIFSLGGWYHVDPDHVAKVERLVREVPTVEFPALVPMQFARRPDGSLRLEREDEYNQRIALHSDFVLFDKELFRESLPGQSRIEVCDLLHRDGGFFCVKKYEGSSDLSHLFAQGAVSAELFFHMREYREFTSRQIGGRWPCPFDVAQERPAGGCRLIYAIACPEDFTLPDDLPFFSKLNLLKFKRNVYPLGWKVELAKITVPSPPDGSRPLRRRRTADLEEN